MKVKSESEVAQSCPTLHNLMDCSLLGSSTHGIFQARVLEWGAIAFSNEVLVNLKNNMLSERSQSSGLSWWLSGKELACQCWGEGNGTLLQYSCLENPMDGGAW